MSQRILLVVDDDDSFRDVLQDVLRSQGYAVVGADTGHSALERLVHDTPDLVVLDIMLPDMSGWDLLRLMRSSGRWRGIPVVILSGLGDDGSTSHGWDLDCACYLCKPLKVNDFLLVVRRILSGIAGEQMLPHPILASEAVARRSE